MTPQTATSSYLTLGESLYLYVPVSSFVKYDYYTTVPKDYYKV